MTTTVNLDAILEGAEFTQASLVEWCFKNFTTKTWGIKAKSGITYLWFDNHADALKLADHWGIEI